MLAARLAADGAQRLHVNERQESVQRDGAGRRYQGGHDEYSGGGGRHLIETDTVTHLCVKTYYHRTCRGDKTRSKRNQEKDADDYHTAI